MNMSIFDNPASAEDFPCVSECGTVNEVRLPYFRERAWDRFVSENGISNADNRDYRMCINEDFECRLVTSFLAVLCVCKLSHY